MSTLLPGEPLGGGTDEVYRRLRPGPVEPHRSRWDFTPPLAPGRGGGRVVATLAHLTDLHVVDPGSPARLDFAMRSGAGRPEWGGAVDWVFRPQELLTAHAVRSMVATLAGLPIDVCVVTGDNIDNGQTNELDAYLALLDGGEVRLAPAYHGPQRPDWDDDWYWRPDPGDDRYKRRWGFPTHPGLLDLASAPFTAAPLGHPWLGCLGNHDLLIGGASAGQASLGDLVTGPRKPVELPDGVPGGLDTLLAEPAALFSGRSRPVPAVPERAFASRTELIRRHLGHGFTEENLRDGTGYHAFDPVPGLRVLTLDTNHPPGHWDGSMDQRQLAWLEDQLARAGGPDGPLVVLASHHATASMNNRYGVCPDQEADRAYAAEVLATALRCPNVVLWLNGHHHANRVTAHFGPGGGGLYEVTTASITDWPSQARLIEIAIEPTGEIRLTSTMIDHAAPAGVSGDLADPVQLAALHRELAYNDGVRAGRRGAEGSVADRNVHLYLPAR
ncbi:hypothetical protein ACWEPC_10995 [Nonomuraea sp. NPDC004297]